MFRGKFQKGTLSILYSCGAAPLEFWDIHVGKKKKNKNTICYLKKMKKKKKIINELVFKLGQKWMYQTSN